LLILKDKNYNGEIAYHYGKISSLILFSVVGTLSIFLIFFLREKNIKFSSTAIPKKVLLQKFKIINPFKTNKQNIEKSFLEILMWLIS